MTHETKQPSMSPDTLRLFEKKWEGNLLNLYQDAYPAAVERVATALRPRFESGELRGSIDADFEKPNGEMRRGRDPLTKIADECARRYIKTPLRALAVLEFSRYSSALDPGQGEEWHWNRAGAGTCLLGAAVDAMAKDVLRFARERGWSKPLRGEHPIFNRSTRRAA